MLIKFFGTMFFEVQNINNNSTREKKNREKDNQGE